MIKIFLVDDHRLIRTGLKKLIAQKEGMEVVAEFSLANQVISEIPRYNPDIVICDINLPDGDGLALSCEIKEKFPLVKVMILSMHKEKSYILRAVQANVDGYMHKDIFEQDLLDGILRVYQGDRYFSKEIAQIIINNLYGKTTDSQVLTDLTSREKEVLKLITEGFKNREIADKLFISTKTVDKHRANLLQKLNARNTAELVKYAIQQNMV
ncbi:MAG: response regulator transcription factor [Microscillaceae bacterium]|nr:response regulator transcription factor [Microscillaceae bacterium]